MSNKRNNLFSTPKPPPEDVSERSNILANFPSIEEWDDEGNDIYWNWAFDNLFPNNQDQEQHIGEQQLGYEEEPDDDVDDDIDEKTINRWRNHDPWEDERSTESDCSFDSIFND
ncbi:hypothetical protein E3N88_01918 [Mikania micrantha]|uniref:Uncharacterized protein n=1 Tax=Mikania micrantha TaxID=192012 RepID=A0A5N6Q2J9_9ASTR|nr:hypothetical protein E3N88_01918 [Mikania micrantha]